MFNIFRELYVISYYSYMNEQLREIEYNNLYNPPFES